MKRLILICLLFCLALPSCNSPSGSEAAKILPRIISFLASVSELKRGVTCQLTWNVSNADRVVIDNSIGDVVHTGSRDIDPVDTTTYEMTATNGNGSVTATVTITVVNGADIVHTAGPTWQEDTWTFGYFGVLRNQGTYKASFVKIYIYLYDAAGALQTLLDTDYTYVDKTDLDPGEQSPWENNWWDSPADLRNKVDKTKTLFEIEWSEYTWTGQEVRVRKILK